MSVKAFSFDDLPEADLVVDAVYLGGTSKTIGDDPLSKLMRCGNQGGFRTVGGNPTKYVVLYSSQADRDWPDDLDTATGIFTYYGDNKTPGSGLHETNRGGNKLLAGTFAKTHASSDEREKVPPFFVFEKVEGEGRRVQYRGLAAPGAAGVAPTNDLVAVWKSSGGDRFQNYKSTFTILNVPEVPRSWLNDLQSGNVLSENCPAPWRKWVETGFYEPLHATPSYKPRTPDMQRPTTDLGKKIVAHVYSHFAGKPTAFESCAAEILRLLDPNKYVVEEITRPSVDGGRDAIGHYRLGPSSDPITIDYALEAKCYCPGLPGSKVTPVGVKDTSRLISRLLHRQFGVLVTTSYVAPQAYEEIREDGHPVILLCGRDIAEILIENGYNSIEVVSKWLEQFEV